MLLLYKRKLRSLRSMKRNMVVDVELSLNYFGLGRLASNKMQVGPFRISWWSIRHKHGLSFEVNWRKT